MLQVDLSRLQTDPKNVNTDVCQQASLNTFQACYRLRTKYVCTTGIWCRVCESVCYVNNILV